MKRTTQAVIYEAASEEETSSKNPNSLKGSHPIFSNNKEDLKKSITSNKSKTGRSKGGKKKNPKKPGGVSEIETTTQSLKEIDTAKVNKSGTLLGEIKESENELEVPLITFQEANNYYLTSDYFFKKTKELEERQEKNKGCVDKCCSCLIGKLPSELKQEKNLIYCIRQTNKHIDFDKSNMKKNKNLPDNSINNGNNNNDDDDEKKNDEMEYRILYTIYNFYTKENKCPKVGEHWQEIGFQSDQPKNDLLTIGAFGPLQFLYYTEKYSYDSYELYKFLVQQKCAWVFAKTMFDITKIVINLMDTNALDYFFKTNNKVNYVMNEVFVGMVYYFNQMVREYCENNSLTLQYIASVIQEIRSRSYTEISEFMQNHMREK